MPTSAGTPREGEPSDLGAAGRRQTIELPRTLPTTANAMRTSKGPTIATTQSGRGWKAARTASSTNRHRGAGRRLTCLGMWGDLAGRSQHFALLGPSALCRAWLSHYSRPKLRRLAKLFFPIISESCSAIFMTLSARSTCWLKLTSAFDGVGSPEGDCEP
jgi:hypothetical protein